MDEDWLLNAILLTVVVVPMVLLFGYAAFDVIRRPNIGVVHRALWLIAFCVFPIAGPLVYLVIRPPGLTAQEKALAGDEESRTAELTAMADLHDRGKLTDDDFNHVKARLVYGSIGTPGAVGEQRSRQPY
jgi:hypothetical protein